MYSTLQSLFNLGTSICESCSCVGGGGDLHSKYCRHSNALCKWPLILIIGAILGRGSNVQAFAEPNGVFGTLMTSPFRTAVAKRRATYSALCRYYHIYQATTPSYTSGAMCVIFYNMLIHANVYFRYAVMKPHAFVTIHGQEQTVACLTVEN